MKAAILTELNQPLTIGDVIPQAPGIGHVLVKIIVSGLCGSQLLEIAGCKGNAKFVPHLLGHEGCGIVEATGLGVTKVKRGNKVVMHWMKGDGIEADFPKYLYNGKEMTSGKCTTLSEYSIVSENRLTVVDDDADPELCALLGCGMTTGLGTINNDAHIKLGEGVMILGCGGVGLNLIQGARLAGAYPIVGADIVEEKRDLAIKVGASHFLNPHKSESGEQYKKIFGKKGADVIIDTTGNCGTMATALTMLGDSGRFIMVGHPQPARCLEVFEPNHMFGGTGKTIKATQGGQTNPSVDIPRYVRLHKAGLLKIDNIITHRYNLDNINTAIDVLRSGACGRIIISI